MAYITSNGIRIYYEVHGEGAPLLLIQGTLDSTAWACQVPALSERYKVIIFDHRGMGRTDAPDGPYTVEELAEDTFGLIDALGVKKTHILGYSLGGCVALEMAARRPAMVDGLVLACTYNRISNIGRYRTQSWIEMFEEDGRLDRVMREFMPWMFSDSFFENAEGPQAVLNDLMSGPVPLIPHGVLGLAKAIVSYQGIEDLTVIKSPTLVISGTDDIAVPLKQSKKIVEGIPGAQLTIHEGAAHSLIIEDAERFNSAVLEFLGKL